ncbi:MAG: TIGR04086 family membrane protein, partial [Oscillospiraceae bacterium]
GGVFLAKTTAVKKKNQSSEAMQFAKCCSVSSGISIVIAAALMCVTAVVLVNVDVPFELHQPLTTIITALSTLVGKKRQKTGLIMGLSVGGLVFLVLFLLSAVFGDRIVSMQTVIKLAALLSAGGLGGLTGVNRGLKAKKVKH